jgi:hypothetical protein
MSFGNDDKNIINAIVNNINNNSEINTHCMSNIRYVHYMHVYNYKITNVQVEFLYRLV